MKKPKKDKAKRAWLLLLPLYLFTLLPFTACSDDDLSDTSVFDGDSITQNAFDKWLYKNYVLPYNIRVLYKLPDLETDFSYEALAPAELNQAIQFSHIVKHAWLGAYDEIAGIDFTRQYAPKQIMLVGSYAVRSNGVAATLGTAEGGMKIVLYGINVIDMMADNNANALNETYLHTMHHEFVHILNQMKDYPTDFQRISEADYISGEWQNFTGSALASGFVSKYAMSEAREDFAETAATYLSYSTSQWEWYIDEAQGFRSGNPERYDPGIAKVYQKLAIVKKYFMDSYGIDLETLHDVVQRRLQEVGSHLVDLNSLD